jgi:subtilisin family serine protease
VWAVVVVILAAAALVSNPVAQPRRRPGVARLLETVNGRRAAAAEVLVKFRRPLAAFERSQLDQQTDADQQDAIGSTGVRRLHSRRFTAEALLAFLRNHPDVEYAEPNYLIEADAVPNDGMFNQLWGLLNLGQVVGVAGTPGADISATSAWDITTGSTANVVAVVDTGIDYSHVDLSQNVWSAPRTFNVTIGGQTITCDIGTHGFNAILKTCDPADDNGHGTHVSGTIGARGNNGIGVAGVNWTTTIMASKFLDANGVGTTADAINALEFVIQAATATGANVRVLSNSWSSGGFSQALLDVINKANANNMLFVASAGNNATSNDAAPRFPANYGAAPYNAPNVIAVASTKSNDALAGTSNFGAASVHLAAPGEIILSTVPFDIYGTEYQYFSGTSMAVPHVAGAAMLVLSRCALTTAQLKDDLLATVDPIPALNGVVLTGGRLNVNAALRACLPDFSLTAPSATKTTQPGTSTSFGINVASTGGFTGAVSFTVSGLPSGATASFAPASVTSPGSTLMTVTPNASVSAGSYPLTITGTSGSLVHTATVTLVISGTTTTTTVAADTNPSIYGSGVLFTASVSGSGTVTGTVTFKDGPTTLGSAPVDSSGHATFTTSSLAAGSHAITAAYGGDATFSGSTSAALSQVVNKAPLTVTADNKSRGYGDTNPTLTASFGGFKNGETLATSGVTGAPNLTTTATGNSSVGSYAITVVAGTLASANYTFTFVNGSLSVAAAPLTVTADNKSRGYGDTNPTLTASFGGFKNGETLPTSGITGAPALTTPAVGSSAVGSYPIVVAAGTLASANYTFTFVNGSLSVTPAPLTVTADNKSRGYGDANPVFTATFGGFKNGETLATSGVNGAPSLTTTATASSAAGSYPIAVAAGTLASANYTFTFVSGSLTITRAALTVTAGNQSRGYGDANPTLAATFSGFRNGESLATSGVTGAPTLTTTATANSAPGSYPITVVAGNLASSNYTFTFVNGTLTINKAALTVTADDKSRVYGDANPALTASFSGFKNGETPATSGVSGTPGLTTTATSSSGAGTYPIAVAAGTLASANYSFTFVSGSLTVNKAPLGVAADNQLRGYGDPNLAFTATYSGFRNNDTLATSGITGAPSVTTTAVGSSTVGSYPITVAAGTLASANYTFAFVNGSLQITAAPLTVTADSKSRGYGSTNPTLTASFGGFKNGETPATSGVTGAPSLTTTATAGSVVGNYPITVAGGTLASANYTFTFASGSLSVTAAVLTITANDRTRVYGAANPPLTVSYSGFVNGDTPGSLATPPTVTTTATTTSGVGTYPRSPRAARSARTRITRSPTRAAR